MSLIKLKNSDIEVTIDTFGAEIKSVKDSNGTEFMWEGDPNVWARIAPVIFPICGGLKEETYIFNGKKYNMPKHGFAKNTDFKCVEATDTEAVLSIAKTDETFEVYPFDFEFYVKFKIDKNMLYVTYETHNLSDTDMYFSVGGHEGYACPESFEEYDIVFSENETLDSWEVDGCLLSGKTNRIITNDNVLSLKKEYFLIDALIFKNMLSREVSLRKKDGKREVKVSFDGADYLLLWTKPDGKYLCIEPWCGFPETLDSSYDITQKEGIIRLEGKKTHSVSHSMTFNAI